MNRFVLSAAVVVIGGAVASAHGPQMQVTVTGGKIVTREVMIGVYSPLTAPKTVYAMPAALVTDNNFPTAWRAAPDANPANPFGPGVAYGEGGTFAPSTTLTLSFLDELKVWDGAAFASAGATELAMLRTSNPGPTSLTGNAGISGTSDPLATVAIPAMYTADAHASVTYVLLGDGANPASAVADGLYRAALQFTSSDTSVQPSDPFYVLISKGADTQLDAAIASMGVDAALVQAIPEPAAASLAALALSLLTGSRRRKG
jgi:hypothetical protein